MGENRSRADHPDMTHDFAQEAPIGQQLAVFVVEEKDVLYAEICGRGSLLLLPHSHELFRCH